MAKSQYEYVKSFEQDRTLLPKTWMVVRVDGRGFSSFVKKHGWEKPVDERGAQVMEGAARRVIEALPEVVMGYGHSDEFSFVFPPSATLFSRREIKIVSTLASMFTAGFIMEWGELFADLPLASPPIFDARAVLFPSTAILRDYLAWRQVDCHINNLINTGFWALVHDGVPRDEASEIMASLDSGGKNELLYSRFGINYNNEPERNRKGSAWVRVIVEGTKTDNYGNTRADIRRDLVLLHTDMIKDVFWEQHPYILQDIPLAERKRAFNKALKKKNKNKNKNKQEEEKGGGSVGASSDGR